MMPIMAAVPVPFDVALGLSLVVPAVAALMLCCIALLLAARRSAAAAPPRIWRDARPGQPRRGMVSYAGGASR